MLTVYATEISEIYGHGQRFVIWFSGCSIRCKGCINSHMWEKESGKSISVEELIEKISLNSDLKGVTYIGGEPLDQGKNLLKLSQHILKKKLDLILFTGYELKELNELQSSIADLAVVIISGRFDNTKRDTMLLHRGSSNQKIIIKDPALLPEYENEQRQMEIIISAEDEIYLGFPEELIQSDGLHRFND